MDHGGMDHGGMHGGHGDMDMGDQCNMNMLFTWSTKNLCIVFRQWRITGPFSLLVSILVVVLLSAGYEAIRDLTRRYEASSSTKLGDSMPSAHIVNYYSASTSAFPHNGNATDEETSSLLGVARNTRQTPEERRNKMVLAALYAVQVFYSFFIMLLFMTYNGWIMISVAAGAFVGYMAFGQSSSSKTVSCH